MTPSKGRTQMPLKDSSLCNFGFRWGEQNVALTSKSLNGRPQGPRQPFRNLLPLLALKSQVPSHCTLGPFWKVFQRRCCTRSGVLSCQGIRAGYRLRVEDLVHGPYALRLWFRFQTLALGSVRVGCLTRLRFYWKASCSSAEARMRICKSNSFPCFVAVVCKGMPQDPTPTRQFTDAARCTNQIPRSPHAKPASEDIPPMLRGRSGSRAQDVVQNMSVR